MATYLDNNATTALSPSVLASMMPFLTERYQNVASIAGEVGGLRHDVTEARRRLASLLGLSEAEDCVFTSGATEANNWALQGVARQASGIGHFVTTAIEHPSVLEVGRRLQEWSGWSMTVVEPDRTGIISAVDVVAALCPETRLVSVMLANNETGVIQAVGSIARAVKAVSPSVVFHSDITQAVGKVKIALCDDLDAVDLASLSAHKFHGPKGVGALVIRGGTPIEPLLVGGGQEHSRRSGTINLPGVVGCGAAALEAAESLTAQERVRALRDGFESRLRFRFPQAVVFGDDQHRLPNTSCFALPGIEASSVADALALREVWLGIGSACSSGALQPPRTLLAMGVPHSLARSALRVSLSRYTLEQEIDCLLAALDGLAYS